MSNQYENSGENASGATGAEQGEDLSANLAGGEVEFVGTSEEKKPMSTQYAILVGLVILGPLVGWYLYKGKGPDAADGATPHGSPAAQSVHTFLDSGQDGVAAMRKMLNGTEKIVKDFLAYPSTAQIPLNDLKTNPFRARKAEEKVDDSAAASKRRKEEEREAIVKAAGALQLQSIIAGKKGACMINNTMYMEGQQCGQFTIEKISQGTVVVKSGTYKFELKIQK
jgi:hypothetical protein